jgi:hypothetical protein
MNGCSSGIRQLSLVGLVITGRLVWCCLSILLLAGVARGEQVISASDQRIVKVQRATARNGYVIIDGRYLAPPYAIEQRGDQFFIGGQFIQTVGLFSDREDGDDDQQKSAETLARQQLARIKDRLEEGVLLIAWGREYSVLLDKFDTALVLDVLLSESSPDNRAQLLVEQTPFHWVSSEQWEQIAERFDVNDDLRARAGGLLKYYRKDLDKAVSSEQGHPLRWMLSSRPVAYGITVVAMMLAVLATGNLLNSRPEGQGRWPELNDSVEDRRKVVHNVVLLGALSTVDLLLTLSAQQTGTLVELNPLGSQLLANPAMLAVFKLSTLAMVCLILLSLRGYRGAQIASWWICLLCTILTYRWLTFNSLFIS